MRIIQIKIDDGEGISEYKVTSKDGCCYRNLMHNSDRTELLNYLQANTWTQEELKEDTLNEQ